jgi:hypothetical protein
MKEIPTAEELATNMQHDLSYDDLINPIKFASLVAIELTKIHVKAALKKASEKVEMIADENQDFRLQNCNCVDYLINKNSILEAYTLDLIK